MRSQKITAMVIKQQIAHVEKTGTADADAGRYIPACKCGETAQGPQVESPRKAPRKLPSAEVSSTVVESSYLSRRLDKQVIVSKEANK